MKGKILTNGALRKAKRQSIELYGCPVNLLERPSKRQVFGKRIQREAVGKSYPAVEESSHAVEENSHGIYF